MNICRKEANATNATDTRFKAFTSEVLKLIVEKCARHLYRKATFDKTYFYPELMGDILFDASLTLAVLPR